MRLFNTSQKRNTFSLDGLWNFKIDPDNQGQQQEWYNNFPSDCDKMCVPHCWNAESEYFRYEGKAWYNTEFETERDCWVLNFDTVLNECEVYIDGKKTAYHYGGFTGFRAEGCGKGKHNLTVIADNTHDDMNTIPLQDVDWFHYGGISGSVTLTEFDGAHIDTYKINYSLKNNTATGKVSFDIKGYYFGKARIVFDGKEIATFDAKTGQNNIDVSFGEIERWDVDNPQLYKIQIIIDTDDIIERIGFRSVCAKDKKIYLNGKELTIKGVNRHNVHPDFGFAMPFSLIKRDVDIIKGMNCNMIRGSHYPNPEMLLDYLDETGMLFWEEIPMWGFNRPQLSNSIVVQRGLKMHKEMVERDYHHPSIIMWGLHNEIDTSCDSAYSVTKAFAELVRSKDNTRLVTYASYMHGKDICFKFADVISVNIYPGWYKSSNVHQECKNLMDKIIDNVSREDCSHKPLIVSEFGGGAIYGNTSFNDAKWTEQYQAQLLKTLIPILFEEYKVNGTLVWQYCDIYSSFARELQRPRSFNNKGLVDEYRRPKLGFYAVKDAYENL